MALPCLSFMNSPQWPVGTEGDPAIRTLSPSIHPSRRLSSDFPFPNTSRLPVLLPTRPRGFVRSAAVISAFRGAHQKCGSRATFPPDSIAAAAVNHHHSTKVTFLISHAITCLPDTYQWRYWSAKIGPWDFIRGSDLEVRLEG